MLKTDSTPRGKAIAIRYVEKLRDCTTRIQECEDRRLFAARDWWALRWGLANRALNDVIARGEVTLDDFYGVL